MPQLGKTTPATAEIERLYANAADALCRATQVGVLQPDAVNGTVSADDDEETRLRCRARRQALVLMAASAVASVGFFYGLWLAIRAVL